MLTATASKITKDDIISILGARNTKLILSPMDRVNVFSEMRQKNATSIDNLVALIKDEGSFLVFCLTRMPGFFTKTSGQRNKEQMLPWRYGR